MCSRMPAAVTRRVHAPATAAQPRATVTASRHASAAPKKKAAAPTTIAAAAEPTVADESLSSPSKAPILAQRFRTKLCNKFATTGSCPYVHRCMFAHGEAELRTAGQNVADGLVSEEAIRAFKREQYEARLRAEAAAKVRSATAAAVGRDTHYQHRNPRPSWLPASPSAELVMESASTSQRTNHSATARLATAAGRYRHDPYAEASQWHPLGAGTDNDDDCEDFASTYCPAFAAVPGLGAPLLVRPMASSSLSASTTASVATSPRSVSR